MTRTIVVFAVLVGIFGLLTFWSDDAPPQDADLIPTVSAAAADDAYPVYLKLKDALPVTPKEREQLQNRLDGKPFDAAVVDALVARSTAAAALFAQFSRSGSFHDPNFSDLSAIGPETPVPQMAAVMTAAKLDCVRAENLLKRGRAPEAMDLALGVVDAGRMLTRSHASLLPGLVGLLLLDVGSKSAAQVAASGKLDGARLRAAAARLAAPADGAASLQEGLRYEYVTLAHVMGHLQEYAARNQPAPSPLYRFLFGAATRGRSYLFMPNRTKALFADRFRIVVTEAGKPCLQARVPPFTVLSYWGRPNMVGRILYSIAVPQFEKISNRRCVSEFRLVRSSADAALAAYRLDHGRFPATLDELAPRYLPAAPADPFTGAAPHYSAETGEISTDGKDSEGNPL